ncbi:hypothetical protein [Natroniella sp. ANB-PHB2]|uniref:hypothetical protein n=1 Tax=Natroniella sp. ANB-PHB2 TaxID=3384444 RepID=UPI0038D4DC5C
MGYTFHGPTSFYGLTFKEMSLLMHGYYCSNERRKKRLQKKTGKKFGPSESDWKGMKKFKDRFNLN